MVRPWSPVWVVAAMATSSIRSGGSDGLRRTSSRMQRITRSSARVSAYMPLGPALPNGVRTPSTKTTSRTARGARAGGTVRARDPPGWSHENGGRCCGRCYSSVTTTANQPGHGCRGGPDPGQVSVTERLGCGGYRCISATTSASPLRRQAELPPGEVDPGLEQLAGAHRRLVDVLVQLGLDPGLAQGGDGQVGRRAGRPLLVVHRLPQRGEPRPAGGCRSARPRPGHAHGGSGRPRTGSGPARCRARARRPRRRRPGPGRRGRARCPRTS